MATYNIKLKGGKTLKINGEEGMSKEDILQHPKITELFSQRPELAPSGYTPPSTDEDTAPTNPSPFAREVPDMNGNTVDELPSTMGARQPTKEELITLGTTGAGGAIGGPVGGAAGYSLGELINRKLDGGETTPKQAATDFGKGLLFEYVPKGVMKGASHMVPKKAYRNLIERSLGMPVGFTDESLAKATNVVLDNNIPVSKGGLRRIGDKLRPLNQKRNAKIRAADEAGKTVDPLEVVNDVRQTLRKRMRDIPDNNIEMGQIDKFADNLLEQYRSRYGYNPDTGYPNPIPISEAHYLKRKAQNHLKDFYRKLQRGTEIEKNAIRTQGRAQTSTALKNAVDRQAGTGPENKQMSDLLFAETHVGGRVRKQGKRALISHDITLPATIELAARGRVGAATGIGIMKYISNHPYILSKAGISMKQLKNTLEKGGPIPPAVVQATLYDMYINDKSNQEGGNK